MSNFLVENNINFADKIACQKKKTLPKYIDLDELKSAAYMGLVKAARRYDADFGATFTTFAYYRISGEIEDYLRKFHHRVFLSLQQEEGCLDLPQPKKQSKKAGIFNGSAAFLLSVFEVVSVVMKSLTAN